MKTIYKEFKQFINSYNKKIKIKKDRCVDWTAEDYELEDGTVIGYIRFWDNGDVDYNILSNNKNTYRSKNEVLHK